MKKQLWINVAVLLSLLMGSSLAMRSQTFDVDTTLTPTQMVQNLVGPGVQIFNVQVTANPRSYGYYTSLNTELGTSQGLLLSTGRAKRADSANNSSGLPQLGPGGVCLNCSQFDNNFGGSALLDAAQDRDTYDACMIEFDIVPQGDSLKFAYTFASEEYLEWVGSPFNDVFGFYISGPNIGTDVNLALVPSTSQSVAINNVNNVSNTLYFQNNQVPPGQFVQYDGFTRFLVARAGGLTPCETYHLKLIIADGSDRLYDSGVMIQQIESNPIVVLTTTAGGVDYMVEGCNDGLITFSRTFATPSPQNVTFWVGGTASNGPDFTQLGSGIPLDPTTITIPANQLSVSIPIEAVADNLAEGPEYLTVYLANPLCSNPTALDSVNFYIQDFIDAQVTATNTNICVGQCTDLQGIAETSGTATYAWSPTTDMTGSNTLNPTVCPTVTTTYTLTSTVATCTSEASVTINVSSIEVALSGENDLCATGGTGSINLDILNALPPYVIEWVGPNGYTSSDEDLTGLDAGEYCVTVLDAAGCVVSDCFTINEVNTLQITDATLSDYTCFPISCNGASDGSIDLTVSGGSGAYTYSWTSNNPGFSSSSQDLTNLPADVYTVTITDEAGCVITQTFTLDQPEPVTIQVVGSIDLLCSGVETGEASVEAAGGCSPYFYSWSHDPNLTAPVATNLGNGIYTASVTDINGCQSTGSVTITINPPINPLVVNIDNVLVYPGGYNISCAGAEDGNVQITIADGVAPYVIEWVRDGETVPFSTDEDLTNAPCGSYTLTVTDDNGCEFTQSFDLTCVPDLQITTTVTQNPCGQPEAGIGAITVNTVTGGHGAVYTFSWAGPNGYTSTDQNITALNSGSYVLTVTDALGCTADFTRVVGENDGFVATGTPTNISCGGTCDGSIVFDITPAGTYNFVWTGPNGSLPSVEDQFNLCAGDYEVTISTTTCTETYNFTLIEPTPIEIDVINAVNPVCYGTNGGSIDIDVTGGIGPFTFVWDAIADPTVQFSGSTDEDIFNLFESCYTVTATDQTGCSATETICLTAPQVMDLFVSTSSFHGGLFNISCFGENDGAISVSVSGGTPDCTTFAPYCYNYDWSNCSQVSSNEPNIGGLVAGTYCVYVTDINNCLATVTVTLTEPEEIVDNAVVTNVTCFGANDGTITPNLAGGSGFYTNHTWTQGNIGSNAPDASTLTNLAPGCYTLVVTDSYGCDQTFEWCITEPTPLVVEVTDITQITCPNSTDGGFTFTVSGGTPNYTIDVTGPGLNSSNTTITGAGAGVYTITVTDANGCIVVETVTIDELPPFTVSIDAPVLLPGQLFTLPCNGDTTGVLIATVVGGAGIVTYEWTDANNNVISTDLQIENLVAGNYCFTATDENGCEASACFEITEPAEPLVVTSTLFVYPNGLNISCFGECDGAIDLTVTGGVAPYIYQWDTGTGTLLTDEDQTGLCAGANEVLVTDANGCFQLVQFDLTEPTLLTASFVTTPISCNAACDGAITVTPAGGSPDYTITWTNPVLPDGASQTGLCAGTYEIVVTDISGCDTTLTVTLTEPTPLTGDITPQFVCETGLMLLCAEAQGGTAPYSFQWSNGASSQCITTDIEGEFCVTITDANGCSITICETITVPDLLDYTSAVTSTSCGLNNAGIDLILNTGTPPYTFFWTGPGVNPTSEDQTNIGPGTYDVIITDGNGCTYNDSFTIAVEPLIDVTAVTTNLACNSDGTGTITLSFANAAEPITFEWTGPNGSFTADSVLVGLGEGGYNVVWTDAEGCTDNIDLVITQPDSLLIDIVLSLDEDGFNVSSYGGEDGAIDTEVTGGTPNYTYDWDNDLYDGSADLSGLTAGTYVLTVTDANGCSIDTTIVLTEPSELALPTGLTPNGDGLNDFFVIQGISAFPDNEFKVFNRWGNLVYEKAGYNNEWNGQSDNGEDLPNGTYFVVFTAGSNEFNTYVDLRR